MTEPDEDEMSAQSMNEHEDVDQSKDARIEDLDAPEKAADAVTGGASVMGRGG